MQSSSVSFGDGNKGNQVGINYGSIHLPPEREEIPPTPLSTVPFRRDSGFVSRNRLLDQIHKQASVPGSRLGLVGIGGVGKSQLSVEYSYRVRSQTPETWVFWVHASNAARFEQGFRDIADQAKIPGRQNPTANIFRLVESWLQDCRNGKWLLILDNVDDDGFLRVPNGSTKPLLEFLPRSLNGSIIFTSRSQDVALRIVDYNSIIKIEPLDPSEALELLQRKLGSLAETPDILKLAKELEFMPLAIIQAASYIIHRAPRCSVSQYLEMIQQSDCEAVKHLLNYEAGHQYRDWEAKNSILVTWQISFDHIRRIRPSAAGLLSLMSFFDRQGVSVDLLRLTDPSEKGNGVSSRVNSSKSLADYEFEDDITTLRDFSFISVNNDNTILTMHRLVQLTVRIWLEADKQLERWKDQFIAILWRDFPEAGDEYENWALCQSLFPHLKSAISQRPESQDSLQKWASLLYKGSSYALEIGNIMDSVDMAYRCREERTSIFGPEAEMTLSSTTMLAATYRLAGRWEEAEKLQLHVTEKSKTRFGAANTSTLVNMAHLALTYEKQGRLNEAEKIFFQVMEACKLQFGTNHPHTMTSMDNMARVYRRQGRLEESEKLEVQVVEASKRNLGEKHPDTLRGIVNLAETYRIQGREEEAEKLLVQNMDACKMTLGEDHFGTISCMIGLSRTYQSQKRWKEAEELILQVWEKRKRKLGDDHPDTQSCMAALATIYHAQKRYEEAQNLLLDIIEMSKKKLGADDPRTLLYIIKLAGMYNDTGQWELAEQLYRHAMEKRKRKLGADDPATLHCMFNLAGTLRSSGQEQAALEMMAEHDRLEAHSQKSHPHETINLQPTGVEKDSNISDSTQPPERASEPGGHRKLTSFLRLFSRN